MSEIAAQELIQLAERYELIADAYDLDFDVLSERLASAQRTLRECAAKARERAAELRGLR